MIQTILQVALGGALGASARYLSNMGMMRLMGPGFPYGTMAVNIIGSFLMGVLVVALAEQGNRYAPLLMTGLLGGFTTFSAFSLDAATLWNGGRPEAAVVYVLVSVVVSLAALAVGLMFARSFV